MDGSSWRPPTQGESNGMDTTDWRSHLSSDFRAEIVNKITETLKKHLRMAGPEELRELQKIAIRFEEKIYTAATNQNDYLRKISMKMLVMENKSQAAVDPGMDTTDWRSHLSSDFRAEIVNKITGTLKKHLPMTKPEGLGELQKIAIRFEEKIYTAAANKGDYLRTISMKMIAMENKSQPASTTNSLQSNPACGNQNPMDQNEYLLEISMKLLTM